MHGSVLTVEECAQELKVSSADVLELIERKELGAKKIGTQYRIPINSIEKFLGINECLDISVFKSISNEMKLIRENIFLFYQKPNEKRLLCDVLNEVLELKRGMVTSNTLEWNKDLAKHINKKLGNRYIDELIPKDIQEFLNETATSEEGRLLSQKLLKEIRNLLSTTFKYAFENKYINSSPLTSIVKLPKSNQPNPHDRFLDIDKIAKLIKTVKPSLKYTTIVKLLIMSGLRIGEALGLYWENIDVENNIIHVRQAVVREYYFDLNGKRKVRYKIGSTKTQESIRDIPVNLELMTTLMSWKAYIESDKKLFAVINAKGNTNLVFPNKDGELNNYNTFQNHFQSYLKRHNNQNFNVTFHMLRHSYGSLLLEQNVELITVSRLLGHKNIDITADIYCTVTNKLKLRFTEKMVNVWKSILQEN